MKALRTVLLAIAAQDVIGAIVAIILGGIGAAELFIFGAAGCGVTLLVAEWFAGQVDAFARSQGLGGGEDA